MAMPDQPRTKRVARIKAQRQFIATPRVLVFVSCFIRCHALSLIDAVVMTTFAIDFPMRLLRQDYPLENPFVAGVIRRRFGYNAANL
jgi:hypothetical protein